MKDIKRNIRISESDSDPENVVHSVSDKMPVDETIMDLADAFKAFSDFTRLKILLALLNAEMCVGDIADLLGMTQSAVSHQLKVLKQSNLIKNRREGKTVFYSIADEHVEVMVSNGMEHVLE